MKFISTEQLKWGFAAGLVGILLALTKSTGTLMAVILLGIVATLFAMQIKRLPAFVAALAALTTSAVQLSAESWFGKLKLAGEPEHMSFVKFSSIFFGVIAKRINMNTFGQFGWFEIQFNPGIYRTFRAFVLLGLCWSIIRLFPVAKEGLRRSFSNTKTSAMVVPQMSWQANATLAMFLGFMIFWIAMFFYQWAAMPTIGFFVQGRYALSLFPFLIVSATWAASSTHHSRLNQVYNIWLIATAGLWILCSYWALGLVIERFYWEPGLKSYFAIYERILQYKPVYFKSTIVHFGAVAAHLATGLALFQQVFLIDRRDKQGSDPHI